MDALHDPLVGPMPYTPEWYAKRLWVHGEGVFGGSDAPALCGMSEYEGQQPLNLYRRCLGLETVLKTTAMRMGTWLEPVVRSLYEERLGAPIEAPVPMLMHPAMPFLAATLDGRRFETRMPVELKTTNWRRAHQLGETGTDWVPDDWYLQVQQQLLVTGEQVADLAALIGADDFRVFQIARNEDVIAEIIAAAQEMRQRILDRNPPELNWRHPGTPALVKAMYGLADTVVVLDVCVLDWWVESRRLADEIARLESEKKGLQARVEHAMGNCAVGRFPGGSRELVRRRIDVKEAVRTAYSYVRLYERNAK